MSMEVIVTIVSKLVYNLLKGLITHLYRGEITQLLSTMDIPVQMQSPCQTMKTNPEIEHRYTEFAMV